jgi:hypothetical protein
MDKNIRALGKLASIQANCLGLLSRQKMILPYMATSTTDLSQYMADLKEPLERYIHDEIAILEDVCSSLTDLNLPSRQLTDDFDHNLFVHIALTRLQSVSRFDSTSIHFENAMKHMSGPSIFERYWAPLTVVSLGVLYVHKHYTFSALATRARDLVMNAQETMSGFINQWIISPCIDMFKTIRHKEPRLAIMGAKSLTSDLEVLHRLLTIVFGKNGRFFRKGQRN